LERDLGPLEQIERAVQERAKDISLEMAGPGKDKLRALIADEVARWSLDHRRGLRPYDLADPDLVAERAYRNLAGYGPLEPLLDDDDVWEVMVNGPDAIFVKRHRGRSGYHDEVFHDDEHVIRILTKILDDASGSHRKLDPSEGLQDAQLENGARVHIVHGDVSRGGAPSPSTCRSSSSDSARPAPWPSTSPTTWRRRRSTKPPSAPMAPIGSTPTRRTPSDVPSSVRATSGTRSPPSR
jgi:hypothetical protein